MDQKLLRSYNKESMKSAMLNHEKIFREQVYELHRLYRVQKLLMNTTKSASLTRSAESDDQLHGEQLVIDESEIQLTLGPSIHHQKRSCSGQSFTRSNSTVSSQIRNNGAPTTDSIAWNFDPSVKNGMQMNPGEERLTQDRLEKHPPWLFQALSLNLT